MLEGWDLGCFFFFFLSGDFSDLFGLSSDFFFFLSVDLSDLFSLSSDFLGFAFCFFSFLGRPEILLSVSSESFDSFLGCFFSGFADCCGLTICAFCAGALEGLAEDGG